ncbi:endonuclease/exonuclease/phosphatase family protein [Actinorugispora endophytica]|uniref:Exonuclease III n=1 Tax=Actinorugispora endophytica TaxID=1605990 RepID=A0A4R6V058_9ACTN|nr:endonuclease/exonuclease/phosphatase family protein [Actinorugispora endophytica]TDQ53124.1 exonuclease III [Actinorugispora endophytica]
MVSVLTLNIGAAAEPRAQRLLDWLDSRDEEVIVLSETSSGPGTALLLDRYTKAGWDVVHCPDSGGERGVAVLSRVATVRAARPEFTCVSIPGRAAYTVLDTQPRIGVLGLYVPNTKLGDKKKTFVSTLLAAVRSLPDEQLAHLVVAGDYNVISRSHQPPHSGFAAYEYALLDGLERIGMVDAHTRLHPDAHPHSWVGRTGDGYRYDYIYAGLRLAERITGSAYLHEPRTPPALTDHSAVTLDLVLDSTRLLDVGDPAAEDTPTLF